MRRLVRSLLALGVLGAGLAFAGWQEVSAQSVRRTSGDGADLMSRPYGTSPGEENRPVDGSTRDANGNRVIVNGQYAQGGVFQRREGMTGGVGRTGAGVQGTAIGNALNVVVSGRYNTVIVTAEQVNNGDQTVVLNGSLDLDGR